MNLDATVILAILDQLESYSLSLGYFEYVNKHEPKSAPPAGLTAAIWLQQLDPLPRKSGLNSTSGRLVWMERIYQNMLYEPQDAIDPRMLEATSALVAAFSGDFDLGGNVRNVDLLGEEGIALSARAGYLTQDGKLLRIYDITVPVICNDLWTQAA